MKKELQLYQQRVESVLHQQLEQLEAPRRFKEALQYATLNQGKRIRPALIYAVGDALKTPLSQLDAAAAAIELIHSYSLVHDDLPAMDDDDLRRGQPTCHIQYDEATAILVGDAQQTLAFEILSTNSALTDAVKIRQIRILSQASGAEGMVAGQVLDMAGENQELTLEQLETIHQHKTGALLTAALLLGASAHEDYLNLSPALKTLGSQIGLAFQVQDDILDIESDTATLGKPQGSDLNANKATYPKILGLDKAKAYRDELISNAHQTLKALPFNSPFLNQLIDYIATRRH